MKYTVATIAVMASLASGTALAAEGPIPSDLGLLSHVFVIMMENHGYSQIIGNPNAPFTNRLAQQANLATNYFAVAHPSLNNYLEVVGGSNFGIQSDNNPNWHNTSCVNNLHSGTTNTDSPPSPSICPIWGVGTDAPVPAIDCTNEVSGPPCENNLDGIKSIPASPNTLGITIADQLTRRYMSWKSYQESLPMSGADGVNASDGFYTDSTNFGAITPAQNPALSSGDLVSLYASKHNPFVYFASVQSGANPNNSLANSVDWQGPGGLFADLATGNVPNFSFIVPNQCNDQHGRGNAGAFCNFDPNDDGSQAGLNPALIYRGDVTVQRLWTAIHASPAWKHGRNAIVILWDENDYSTAPNINQVPVIIDTNYGSHGKTSNRYYTHYSLLKSIESGFGLPCLNHACDANVESMTDLFN